MHNYSDIVCLRESRPRRVGGRRRRIAWRRWRVRNERRGDCDAWRAWGHPQDGQGWVLTKGQKCVARPHQTRHARLQHADNQRAHDVVAAKHIQPPVLGHAATNDHGMARMGGAASDTGRSKSRPCPGPSRDLGSALEIAPVCSPLFRWTPCSLTRH